MIRKVLIAEDHQSANLSLQKTLGELSLEDADTVYYCDDALQRIEIACEAGDSYDLLITDLHFEADHRSQQLANGIELIVAARKVQPDLKILVFSAESKPAVINTLLEIHGIDGYVKKARHDAEDLKTAIHKISKGQRHIPRQLAALIRQENAYEFTAYDVTIIKLLAEGMAQKNIPDFLKQHKIQPSSLSSVEKKLNEIRDKLHIYKNEQLVLYCREIGVI